MVQLERLRKLRKLRKQIKNVWMRDIFENREQFGAFETLSKELKEDPELFFRFMRMTPKRFEHLLSFAQPRIEKQDTNFRTARKPPVRLALTLRYLASGESQQSLSFSFRMRRTTLGQILSETSDAIFQSLKEPYIKCPNSPEDWKAISQKFEE